MNDLFFMQQALDQARNAWAVGEVPVGAVVVKNNQLIATGFNQTITQADPTGHAEIIALRAAAQLEANYRLPDCDLYVTLEPCAMCAMALMHARFRRVIFAASDLKTGACGGNIDISKASFNHQTLFQGGVLADVCGQLLRDFFADRRRSGVEFPAAFETARQANSHAVEIIEITAISLPIVHNEK